MFRSMLRYKYTVFYKSPSSAAVLQRLSQSAFGAEIAWKGVKAKEDMPLVLLEYTFVS